MSKLAAVGPAWRRAERARSGGAAAKASSQLTPSFAVLFLHLQLLENFKQAMLARPEHSHWAAALARCVAAHARLLCHGGVCHVRPLPS